MLKFNRIEPVEQLRPFIHGYWQIQNGELPELMDLVPDGFPEIAIPLQQQIIVKPGGEQPRTMPGAGVIGQLTTRFHSLLPPHANIVFIKMYPWTPYLLFDTPVWHLNNKITDLESLTNNTAFRQLIRNIRSCENVEKAAILMDVFFLKKLAIKRFEQPFLAYAIQQIFKTNGTTNIESLRQNIHASRRYVEKLFKKNIGLTPKQYARLIRVKKASIIMQHKEFRGQIAAVAAELNYYDQSHFLKDFKMVVGITPSQFLQQQSVFPIEGMETYLGQWDYS